MEAVSLRGGSPRGLEEEDTGLFEEMDGAVNFGLDGKDKGERGSEFEYGGGV